MKKILDKCSWGQKLQILACTIFMMLFIISIQITNWYTPKPVEIVHAATVGITCSGQTITQGVDFSSGDDLTLTGNGTCTLSGAASLTSLTVGNAAGTASTVLTHEDNTTTQTYTLDITTTGSATIHSGASLNVDGLGYNGGGASSSGHGPGGGVNPTSYYGGGGGHGGNGGDVTGLSGGDGGSAYCSIDSVTTIGSGGGGRNFGNVGNSGSGGGLITLDIGGTLTIDGTISADGAAAVGGYYGGGGSGGGVNITADTIAGTPDSFTVTGGNGGFEGGGGTGSGGCVNINYTTANSITGTDISMNGGTSGGGKGGAGQVFIKQTGADGDLFVINSSSFDAISPTLSGTPASLDSLYVASSANYLQTTSLTVTDLTTTTSSRLSVEAGDTLSITNLPITGNGTGDIRVDGVITPSSGSFSEIDNVIVRVNSGGSIVNGSNLGITSDAGLYLYAGASPTTAALSEVSSSGVIHLENNVLTSITDLDIDAGTAALYNSFTSGSLTNMTLDGGTTTLYDYTTSSSLGLTTLTVNSGATLEHGDNTTAQSHVINIDATTITVNSGGSINVDELGYNGGEASSSGSGPGAGQNPASYYGGGGAHGGDGGDASTGAGGDGGTAYCAIDNVSTIGSGGGGRNFGNVGNSGSGGGLIKLNVSGTLTIDGEISADGAAGVGGYFGGGGAGGGINITADTIAGTPSSFSISGGIKGTGGTGGNGGGGCANINYTTSNSIVGSSITMNGGTDALNYGGAGQAFIKQASANGDLFVINGSAFGEISPTLSGTPATLDTLYVSSAAHYYQSISLAVTDMTTTTSSDLTVETGDTLTITNLPVVGDGTGDIHVSGSITPSIGSFSEIDNVLMRINSGGSITNGSNIGITSDAGLYLYAGASPTTAALNEVSSSGVIHLENNVLTSIADLDIDAGTADLYNSFTSGSVTDITLDGGTTTLHDYTTSSALSPTTLTINSGATLTHEDNTTAQSHVVNISATTLAINSGGSINVDGLGYNGGEAATSGYGPGGGVNPSSYYGGGGAHGGDGGDTSGLSGGDGGAAYCSIDNVVTMGSGGGGRNFGNVGNSGSGGGLIKLNVSGTLTVDGELSADGSAAVSGYYGGGGSGGGINITADTITGTPSSFSMTGGNAGFAGGGGTGGGGCTNINYTTSNSIAGTSITMNGGTTGGGKGGAGQAFIKQSVANGDLYVINGATFGEISPTLSGTPATLDTLYVSSAAHYYQSASLAVTDMTTTTSSDHTVEASNTLTVTNLPIAGDGTGDIHVNGSITPSSGSFTEIDNVLMRINSGGSITNGNSLGITADAGLYLYSGAVATTAALSEVSSSGVIHLENNVLTSITDLDVDAGTAAFYNSFTSGSVTNMTLDGGTTTLHDYTTSSGLSLTTLTINSGATLTHEDNSSAQSHVLNIDATTLSINSGGSINVDGRGYDGGGSSQSGFGPGGGVNPSSYFGGGGGHGGDGGASSQNVSTAPGGTAYCTISDVLTIGSGGGGPNLTTTGNGGGLVRLNVSGTLTIDGTITADGFNSRSGFFAGAGAGGGVNIIADIIAGTPTSFTVNAGISVSNLSGGGGGGCANVSFSTSSSINSGNISASAGTGSLSGSVGLINVSQSNAAPTVSNVSASQRTDGSGLIDISFLADDPDDDDTLQALIEYDVTGGGFSAATLSTTDSDTTATYGDPDIDNAASYQVGTSSAFILTSSGANTVSIVWPSSLNVPTADTTNAQIRITPYDSISAGSADTFSFSIDNADPDELSTFSGTSSAAEEAEISWSVADPDIDSNFDHFEVWFGTNQADVQNRTGTATEWDGDDDANLNTETTLSTTITGLTGGETYYFKIWVVDSFGNETTIADVSAAVLARPVVESITSPTQNTDGSGYLFLETILSDTDSLTVDAAVEIATDGTSFVKASLIGPVSASHGTVPTIDNGQTYPLQTVDATTSNTLTFYIDTKTTGFDDDVTSVAALRIIASDGTNTNSSGPTISNITIDNEAPATVVDIAGGTYASGQSVTITAYTNDDYTTLDPLTEIYYTTDGTEPTTSNYTGTGTGTAVINISTTSTLRFFSVDGAGNQESPKQTEQYNIRSVPVVLISDPVPLIRTNAATYDVTGTITDSNTLVSATVNGTSAALTGSDTAKSFISGIPISGADGTFPITVIAENDLGDTGSTTINIIRDTTAPTDPVVTTTDTTTSSSSFLIDGTKEADSSIRLDGSEIIAINGSTTWQHTASLSAGLNTLTFTSRDEAGNESSSTIYQITLDTSDPVVTIDSYPSTVGTSTHPFTGSTEANSSIYVDDVLTTTADGAGSFAFTQSLAIGANTFTVHAVDEALNTSPDVDINITREAALVSIAIAPASSTTVTAGSTLEFTATGTYDDTTVADVTDIVDWATSNDIISSISNSGVLSSVSSGATTIIASFYETLTATQITSPGTIVTLQARSGGGSGGGGSSEGGEETPSPSPTPEPTETPTPPSPSAEPSDTSPSPTPDTSASSPESTPTPTITPATPAPTTATPSPTSTPIPATPTATPTPTTAPATITTPLATPTPSPTTTPSTKVPVTIANLPPSPASTPSPTSSPASLTASLEITPAPVTNPASGSEEIPTVPERETTLRGGKIIKNLETARDFEIDSDKDSFGDALEEINGSNPFDPNSFPADENANGLPDRWENAYATSPTNGVQDSDGDGCSDVIEASLGLNPTVSDSDGDGLSDCAEINDYNTNPLSPTNLDEVLEKNPVYLNTFANTRYKSMKSVFTGRAPAGSKVILYVDDERKGRVKIGESTATEDNKFLVIPESVADGTYDVVIETEFKNEKFESNTVEIKVQKNLDVEEPTAKRFSKTLIVDGHRTGEVKLTASDDRPVIEGFFEQPDTSNKTKVIAHWRSLLLTSAIIADTSKGDFKIFAPDNLEPGNHTVYLYTVKTEGDILKRSRDVKFEFTVPDPKSATNNIWIYLIIAGIILVIFIIILLRKKKKEEEKKPLPPTPSTNQNLNSENQLLNTKQTINLTPSQKSEQIQTIHQPQNQNHSQITSSIEQSPNHKENPEEKL